MDKNTLDKLRKIELEILDYIVDICNENGIRYYLAYGTLLGAVRHSGFIPWDDDVDICLLRKDYERLCCILRTNCSESTEYYFQEPYIDEDFKYPFAKVRKRGTVFLETQISNRAKEQGIFVDIFPLDKVKHRIGIQKLWSYLIYKILLMPNGRHNIEYKIVKKLSTWDEKKKCKYLVSYGSAYPVEKDVMNVEWFGNSVKLPFEGKEYTAPIGYKEVLKKLYGADYMDLPPIEKRVTHNPTMILFDTERNNRR